MAGTIQGGIQAAATNKARDPDFYRKNGRKSQEAWVRNGRKPRGFATMDKETIKAVGRKGGLNKRGYRAPKLPVTNQEELDQLAQALQAEAKVVR